VGVKKELVPFLPVPTVEMKDQKYELNFDRPKTIGKVKSFYGNFGVMLKAYAYIRTMGAKGLKEVSETAVLNANYLMSRLKESFIIPYDRICMHEFVASGQKQADMGVRTLDMAKRLLDFGYHPPTIYFPLIVHEAIMFEPTETESLETLDEFADRMLAIAGEAEKDPDMVRNAPYLTAVGRLDEVKAARNPVLIWKEPGE
jgi:glycine dehydrogenase subunit 2